MLVYFYAFLLMINWTISFYRFRRDHTDPFLIITRLFYLCVALGRVSLIAFGLLILTLFFT